MKLADSLNFLSKATLSKTWNATKIVSSYYLSKWVNRPIQWGLPITISIEPTTDCNLGCPECPSGVKFFTRPTGYLDMALFENLLSQTAHHLFYLYYYFQGEPYLHPQFLEMVKLASDKKIYTVTSTNGHFLNEKKAALTVASGLDRIIISLDGTTQETYAKYRIGGKYERVIDGIKNLVAAKKEAKSSTPHIILQFIVMQHNEHQIEEVKKLAKELAVDELKLEVSTSV
jgi:MoaA/NifB/PqqE/SkfB family radical SAM enzyme